MPENIIPSSQETKSKKRDMSIYEAASKSLRENKHIGNMLFHNRSNQGELRHIQATYKVKQLHWANQGYAFRIKLLWDHDRLWGTFELGYFKGIFLVDPGPGHDHFEADDDDDYNGIQDEEGELRSTSREYPLVWRGTNSEMPDTLFNSPLTTGKIRFGEGEIWGNFDAMLEVGLPGRGYCEFHGRAIFGPRVVSTSIPEVIDEWNTYGLLDEDEAPRVASLSARPPKEEKSRQKEDDQNEILRSLEGLFNIKSKAIEEEWSSKSQGLTIQFHVDEQKKLWGHFDVGVCSGFLFSSISLDGTLVQFQWRGRESGTGNPMTGIGDLTIWKDRTIRGVFRHMIGDIDFEGTPYSGHDLGFYRRGWEEYGHDDES